jgi:hypothetical protein
MFQVFINIPSFSIFVAILILLFFLGILSFDKFFEKKNYARAVDIINII